MKYKDSVKLHLEVSSFLDPEQRDGLQAQPLLTGGTGKRLLPENVGYSI